MSEKPQTRKDMLPHPATCLSRRSFLQSLGVLLSSTSLPPWVLRMLPSHTARLTRDHLYIAADDHTDYFWTADGDTYRQVFLEMLDYYLDLADATQDNAPDFQSRWNCDGSFWLWEYERNRSPAEFERLIERIRDGHISAPLTPLVVLYGGAPAEAVLRSMYYAGQLERRYDLRFTMAVSMENQTLPYGLVSLWAGAGARYSWKGVCGCATQLSIPDLQDRDHDIYWWIGPDGSRILMKWYSLRESRHLGGYAEMNNPAAMVRFMKQNNNFRARYPYQIFGLFGKGHDDLKTLTDEFVQIAQAESDEQHRVVVSNEEDFFRDFEATYGDELPSVACSYGNEWELYCASMAEVSADVKRLVEKLRTAEALAALVSLRDASFIADRQAARDLAWMSLGLYWEHDWTADGHVGRDVRAAWQVQLRDDIAAYVLPLYEDALRNLAQAIPNDKDAERFFVFNPLNWERTEAVDLPFKDEGAVHVLDISTGEEVPSQWISASGQGFLRILAPDVPSLGYKVFEVRRGTGTDFGPAAVIADGVMEHDLLRVRVAERGAITVLYDKRQAREYVRKFNGSTINDLGDATGTLTAESSGAVSATLRAEASKPIAHTSRITLYRNSNRIDIDNEITENFSDVQTWHFGFALASPTTWHEEVGAVIRAALLEQGGHYAARNARYDWLTLNHFVDMSAAAGHGITLSNADCYYMNLGNSTAKHLDARTPRLRVLAGGQVDGPDLGIRNQNGASHFLQRFALFPHSGYSAVAAMRRALEHQNPLVAARIAGESPSYPAAHCSFLDLSGSDVLLWALKPADDKPRWIARLWNLTAQPTDIALSLPQHHLRSATSVSHIETPTGAARVVDSVLQESLGAYQMRTFALDVENL